MSEENKQPEEEKKPSPNGSLAAALGIMQGDEPAPTEEPEVKSETPVKPEESPKKESTEGKEEEEKPSAAPTLSAKDIRVTKKEAPKSQPTPKEEPKLEKEAPKEEAPAPTVILPPDQQEIVDLIKFGEEKELTKKGTAQKVIDYYKSRAEFLESLRDENLDDEDYEPEKDPKYRRWMQKNKPPVEKPLLRKLEQEQWIAQAEERAYKKLQAEREKDRSELENLKKEIQTQKIKPQVEAEVNQFSDQILANMPEEVTAPLKKGKSFSQLEELMPLEAPIVKQVLNKYSDMAEAYINLEAGLASVDKFDPLQAELAQIIRAQSNAFDKLPPEKKTRGGKLFARVETYKGEPDKWTFTKNDILTILRNKAKKEAIARIDSEKSRLEAYIKRKAQSKPAQEISSEEEVGEQATGLRPSSSGGKGSGKGIGRGLFEILEN